MKGGGAPQNRPGNSFSDVFVVEIRFLVLFLYNKRGLNKKEDGLRGEGRLRGGLF